VAPRLLHVCVLDRVPHLTRRDAALLGRLGLRLVYSAGDVLYRAGATLDTLVLVHRGTVRLQLGDGASAEPLLWLPAPSIVGEGLVFNASAAPITAVAETEVAANVVQRSVLAPVLATRRAFRERLLLSCGHVVHARFGVVVRAIAGYRP
jgi:CRP-like cAMP-binding protein